MRTKVNKIKIKKYLVRYNLQFFAEGAAAEKTEDATPKKLTEARDEGQVAKSQELVTAASLLALFVILKVFIGNIGNSLVTNFEYSYGMIDTWALEGIDTNFASELMTDYLIRILLIAMPVFISAIIVAFVINVFQVKWKITSKPLKPKFNKINPISGFKKIFSKEKLFELVKSIAKISLIAYLVYSTLKDKVGMIVLLYNIDLFAAIALIGDMVINLGLQISIYFIIIGLVDLIYQKMKFKKDMRMSKQEIKDEFKQTEGDPMIKGRIKQKMREASQRRMMQKLPEADVVITNPTHFACAVQYDKTKSEAPVLIAKGADYIAFKIKEAAKENNIPIVENKPLARMLYYNVDLEEEIPPELYQMMAEVLAYVYNIGNKTA